ncbi:MAG TPA: PAS domain S-box protein [Candidatus Sulfotelmatobacter sp.]|nr:PAS domain S-box protein [Candidatus Sulfotelmatobacter sp.]
MRLLIVDDHEVVRRGVRSLLSEQSGWNVCGEAVDGQDGVEKARELKPDLIVMDVSMPRLNGLEATRQVRSALPSCKILILSQHENNEMARQALNAGARGYVVKSSISRDLIEAILKVSQGNYFFDIAILNQTSPTHTDVQEILQRSVAFQKALRESEELYRSTFELTAVGIAHADAEGRWLRANKKFCEIVGYTESELLLRTYQSITHPADLAADVANHEKIKKHELTSHSMEKRYIRKDGSQVWTNLSVAGVWDENGGFRHFISVVEDIDAKKQAEDAVRQTEERLRLAQQAANVGTFEWNIKTGVNRWTPELEQIYGLPPGGFAGTQSAWEQLLHPEDRERAINAVKRALSEKGTGFEEQWRVIWGDGSVHWLLGRAWVLRDDAGVPDRLIGVNVDITERKRVEDALAESQKQLVLALESSKTAMFDWDVLQRRGKWNAQMTALYTFEPAGEYITAEEWVRLFHPDDVQRLMKEAERSWSEGEEFSFEFRTVPRNGEFRWVTSHGRIVRDGEGKAVRMIGIHTDITDRKRNELERRRSDERLKAFFQSSAVGVARSEVPSGKFVEVNDKFCEITGYSREELQHLTVADLTHPEYQASTKQNLARLHDGAVSALEVEKKCLRKDGNIFWAHIAVNLVRDDHDNSSYVIGVINDITARKLSENALASGARRQKALFDLADELHRARSMEEVYNSALNAILDALQCNRASILLCDDSGIMRFKSWRSLSKEYRAATDGHSAWRPDEKNAKPVCITDINTADLSQALKAIVKREGIGALAFIPLVSNGKLNGKFMAYFNTPHEFTQEEIDLSLTIARQLSFAIDRKRNDEVLEQSKKATALLAAIVTSSDDAIVSKTLDGTIQTWNTGAERIFGYTAKEAVGQHITLIIPPDRYAEEDDILARLRRGERIDHFQTIRMRKDGTFIDVSLTISPVRDSAGRVIGASKVARDITAQKRVEQALRESEQSFRSIAETGADAILRMDGRGVILFANQAAEKVFGYKPDELIGTELAILMPDYLREVHRCALQRYLETGERHLNWARTEVTGLHKSGREISVELSLSESVSNEGSVFTGFLRDITERKRAEDALRQSEERFRKLSETLDAEVQVRTAAFQEQATQVRDLSWRLQRTQDEERRRIAREFHDSAGQTLTVLGLSLAELVQHAGAISPELAKEGRQIEEVVQQLHREIRTTSYLLHPPLLDEAGLKSALGGYVQGIMERSRMAIEFSIPEDFGRLPPDIELAIFRVVQECLTNIHRHAQSDTATIRIARENGSICVEVRDNGKGIPPDRLAEIRLRGSGVGIAGIQERLRHFGGTMSIQSDASGTRVLATIPVSKDAHSTDAEPVRAAV